VSRYATAFTVALLLVAVWGCRTAPIAPIVDRPFFQGADLSIEDSLKAIHKGAARRNWDVQEVGPGEALATFRFWDHIAVVRITYDESVFSISLVSSDRLLQKDGKIHKNFNRWIESLAASISKSSQVSDSLHSDSDGDGLSDGSEINIHKTDPLTTDTDKDGLTDGAEVNLHGSDPLDPDSDNDGLKDGEEVTVYLTNPLNPDTNGDGIRDGVEVLASEQKMLHRLVEPTDE
jgi:hypothetical protein